jgi:hypothetical protein
MSAPTVVPRAALELPLDASAAREAKIKSMCAFLDTVNSDAVLGDVAYTANAMMRMDVMVQDAVVLPHARLGSYEAEVLPGTLVCCGADIVQWVVAVLRVHGEVMMTTGHKDPRAPSTWPFIKGDPDICPCPLLRATLHVSGRLVDFGVKTPGFINILSLVEALAGLSRWLIGRRAASTTFQCDQIVAGVIMDVISSLGWHKSEWAIINAARDALADAMFHVMQWLDVRADTTRWDVRMQASWAVECVQTMNVGVMWLSTSSARCVRRAQDTAQALLHLNKSGPPQDKSLGRCQRFQDLLDSHEWVEDAEATAGASARVNTNEST